MHLFFSLLGVAFQIFAFSTYLWSIFRGKTKPHLYTWLLWGILGSIVTIVQITNDAGWSILISGLMAGCNLTLAGLSLKYGETLLTRRDKYLLMGALISIILWQITQSDLTAIILVCMIDAIAFYFTFKKSYRKPHEEKLFSYILWTFQLVSFALAVNTPTLTNLLYPVFLAIMEGVFVLFLIWRRKVVKN
ncbi:hypothetical protein KBB89_00190 [Candidatus Gracilibacteria bacterium]|nr:hypothetical protein [Candidatus Gracilibacteria bacterium]